MNLGYKDDQSAPTSAQSSSAFSELIQVAQPNTAQGGFHGLLDLS